MVYQLPVSDHLDPDPFDFDSSSPEKPASPSRVATRPNPYSVKSQSTLFPTSLRTPIPSFPDDPRLTTSVTTSKITALSQQAFIDSFCSSLEAASSSPRCSSKPPQSSTAAKHSTPTMVKSKSRPVQSLISSFELAASAKRMSCVMAATAASHKRRKNVTEPRKHNSSVAAPSHNGPSRPRSQPYPRAGSPSPTSVSSGPTQRSRSATQKRSKVIIPKITIRAPTPEPEPSLNHFIQKEGSEYALNDNCVPVYVKSPLSDLGADISKVEDSIDDILSKYFDPRKSAQLVGVELLRCLASSMSRLYCTVQRPESQLGQLKLRAISSHMFKHTVTGFIHLLEDALAPYTAASSLALVSTRLLQDFDLATDWCCRIFNGPTQAQQHLKHGDLFLNILNAELDLILDRGLVLTDMEHKLALPGKGSAFSQYLQTMDLDDVEMSPRPGSSEWLRRHEWRKQYAREGDERDRFAHTAVVRFIGQLVVHQVVSVQVLAKWLDRFLVNTVYLGIPSVWEIECACALLITVGPTLDRRQVTFHAGLAAAPHSPASSGTDNEAERTDFNSDADDSESSNILNKAMDRVDHLIAEEQISKNARQWLIQVRDLRERGWRQHDKDLDCLDSGYSSN